MESPTALSLCRFLSLSLSLSHSRTNTKTRFLSLSLSLSWFSFKVCCFFSDTKLGFCFTGDPDRNPEKFKENLATHFGFGLTQIESGPSFSEEKKTFGPTFDIFNVFKINPQEDLSYVDPGEDGEREMSFCRILMGR